VVLFNYHHRQRLLDLLLNLSGCVSPFWHEVLRIANAFKLGLQLNSGEGTSMKFWKDCWIGEIPLAYAFPSFFEVASDKMHGSTRKFRTIIRPSHFVTSFPHQHSRRWRALCALFDCMLFEIGRTRSSGRWARLLYSLFVLSINYCNHCYLRTELQSVYGR